MFDSQQLESLGKILQEGASLGGRRMSELAAARWRVSVSGLRAVDLGAVPALFDQDIMPHTSAGLFVHEPLPLALVLFFPDWGIPPLVAALGRGAPRLLIQGGMERAVISDAANILGHAVLKAFADHCGEAFVALAPEIIHGSKMAALTEFRGRLPRATAALLAQAEFYSDSQASSATLLLLADAPTLRALMTNRGAKNAP